MYAVHQSNELEIIHMKVYNWLKKHADDKGIGYLHLTDIAKEFEISKAAIVRILTILEKKELIAKKTCYENGIYKSSYYQVLE
jgi:DNA-binding MarR family transcriptional regulator